MPKVSVLIPTRNRRLLLRRTLGSVLAQRDVDLDVVVADDCSTDGTAAMIDALGDPRVRVVRQPQQSGVSAARNRAITAATGEWLAFLDDDDLWSPDKLAMQIGAADASGRAWAYCGWAMVTPDLTLTSVALPPSPDTAVEQMPLRNMVPTGASNVVVKRTLLDRAGLFDTRLRHLADWDMWIRLAHHAKPAAVDAPLIAYVMHQNNASGQNDHVPAEMAIVEERYAHLRTQPTVDRASFYRWMAWHHLRGGRRGDAIKAYLQAARSGDPKSLARAVVGTLYPGIVSRVGASDRTPEWHQAREWVSRLSVDIPVAAAPSAIA